MRKTFLAAAIVFICISTYIILSGGAFFTQVPLDTYANDDVRYLHSAKTLLETGRLTYFNPGLSTVFIMPGIIFMLAPFVAAFGEVGAILAFKIFQIMLSVLNIYLVGLISKHIFGEKTGKLAMIFMALYFPIALACTVIYTEIVFTTLTLLLIWLTTIAFEKNSLKHFTIAGFVWTVAVLFRPAIACFPLIMLIMFLVKKYSLKQIFRIALVVTLIFVVCMSPWWIRNYLTFDRFIPLTLSSGSPMLEGTIIFSLNEEQSSFEEKVEGLKRVAAEAGRDEIAFDAQRKADAIKITGDMIKTNFPSYLKNQATKMAMQWARPLIILSGDNTFNLAIHIIAVLLHLFLIISFALKIKIGKSNNKFYLLLIILYFNFIHLPFIPLPRYMFPVMPLVIMFVADAWANFKFKGVAKHEIHSNSR